MSGTSMAAPHVAGAAALYKSLHPTANPFQVDAFLKNIGTKAPATGNPLTRLQKYRYAYVREFFDRIEEIRYIQKRLWKLIEDNPDKPILQKSCLSELHQSTITL